MNNPLCILAAGRGSRLGAFTDAVNKALLPVKDKAVISHIIEKMPVDSRIVVALGYQGDKVRQYCLLAHPNRKFCFVNVPNYDGPGSGPGRSMWECREYLQEPFYFCTADCMVKEKYRSLDRNWLGTAETDTPQNFCTIKTYSPATDDVYQLINKKAEGTNKAFIGLAGIKSYEHFWKQLAKSMTDGKEAELVAAFYDIEYHSGDISLYDGGIYTQPFTWLDTGTIENYARTRRLLEGDQCFDFNKVGEFTYIVGDRVIKYFDDPKRVEGRIDRGYALSAAVPRILQASVNFFAYELVPGTTLYNSLDDVDDGGKSLYDWCQQVLWRDQYGFDFKKSCMAFYKDKTYERYNKYKKIKGIEKDKPCMVKGVMCREIEYYLDKVDWDWLASTGIPVAFHGDLQFDNIIRTPEGKYRLIDWRDGFADQRTAGDLYYDLAKLNGGMILPYDIIKSGQFIFYRNHENSVVFDWGERPKLKECHGRYRLWLYDHVYDIEKIDLLTTLIYLNMSPLHVAPFDELLWNLAKMRFALDENKRRDT